MVIVIGMKGNMKSSEVLDASIARINKFGWRNHGECNDEPDEPLCLVWTLDRVTENGDEFDAAKTYINRVLGAEPRASISPWNDYQTKERVLQVLDQAAKLAREEGR